MISFNSDLVIAWSYVLSISALRQPRSSTSASSARSRSAGLLNSSRTFFTRKVVCQGVTPQAGPAHLEWHDSLRELRAPSGDHPVGVAGRVGRGGHTQRGRGSTADC